MSRNAAGKIMQIQAVLIFFKFFQKRFGKFKTKQYLCIPQTGLEDSLAQLVEHHTFNVGVSGSSPERVTSF